jgi:hypothetical protein
VKNTGEVTWLPDVKSIILTIWLSGIPVRFGSSHLLDKSLEVLSLPLAHAKRIPAANKDKANL